VKPTVAVIIPCYNSLEYIDECIESVIQQDYENVKIFVYDNESTDGTYQYLVDLAKNGVPMDVLKIKNIYPNSYREAFDHAFRTIDADYFTFIASDDYVSKEYVSNCMKIILHNPKKIKCIQSPIIGVQNGVQVNTVSHSYQSLKHFKELCMERSPVCTPTVFYHRSIYEHLNMEAHRNSNVDPAGAADYDMFCSLADNGVLIYPIPHHTGYYYRWHGKQCTWKVHEKKKEIDYDVLVQEYWKNKWQNTEE
jgi:glycosyltransferase involved in cell wall biosynthesis